ncbi:hypothetical protein KIN20_002433 [Parelaphostrongylus tenuis]|uniref:Tyrosine-protein kinase n=1 Tax=Parelaphostrongylus tenuis TaxID=148309 RepID=A0AAD5QFB4_PARTN|nr:hypothetical protein KIN20_002433 [Parelaphostrongylus tenuis]
MKMRFGASVVMTAAYRPNGRFQSSLAVFLMFLRVMLQNVEKETMDKVMATLVDEVAEKITADLQREPWYHGALPLEDISALVTSEGDFLIRELEADKFRGPMPCLTVRLGSQLKDFPVYPVQTGEERQFTINGTHTSKTVVGIVQKHYHEKIAVQDNVLLLKPIPKQPWELSKDKITLNKKLGEGAFGEVWEGTLRQSATQTVPAAIKVTKLKEDNKRYMQDMLKEARLMRQYQHLNVVGFFGMIMENDNVMIVMEMVNGGGLDHYLKKNTVGIPDKSSYSFDVALGLYYLHSKRCMHRDLACRNCLIDTEKNIVKISDFGLSKQADVYVIQPTEKIPTKRQAPEVIAKHIYTRRSDVYSYGIVVWEIFNNAKPPFEEYDNKTFRKRISDPNFRPPLSADIPKVIRVIVTACWSAVPEHRPPMKDVAWILRRFEKHNKEGRISEHPTPPTPAALPPVSPSPSKPTKQPSTTPSPTTIQTRKATATRKSDHEAATGRKHTDIENAGSRRRYSNQYVTQKCFCHDPSILTIFCHRKDINIPKICIIPSGALCRVDSA